MSLLYAFVCKIISLQWSPGLGTRTPRASLPVRTCWLVGPVTGPSMSVHVPPVSLYWARQLTVRVIVMRPAGVGVPVVVRALGGAPRVAGGVVGFAGGGEGGGRAVAEAPVG